MPTAPAHPCAMPHCPTLVPGGVRHCAVHADNPSYGWRGDTQRIRGRKLQRLRADLFAKEPTCRRCAKDGRLSLATIRDHIIPLAEGGTDDPDNIQPLCQSCSDVKTYSESRRGRGGV